MIIGKCDVCKAEGVPVGVSCVPGCPISAAYCMECLKADAHPWDILVANTVCIGGLENAAEYWKQMVDNTCKYLNKTIEQFNEEVNLAIN